MSSVVKIDNELKSARRPLKGLYEVEAPVVIKKETAKAGELSIAEDPEMRGLAKGIVTLLGGGIGMAAYVYVASLTLTDYMANMTTAPFIFIGAVLFTALVALLLGKAVDSLKE
jgi:hypothetical protein